MIWSGTARRPLTQRTGGASDENELIARVGKHDLQAFEMLYRLYQPRLTRFLQTLLRAPQLVEEVLDDTMMVVWQTAERFRGASRVSTWIFAIAYRKASKARLHWPDPVDDRELEKQTSPNPGPDEELHHTLRHEALVRAMDQLSPDHRAVLDLTYFHGMGYREIAEIMHCPTDTVKTRMFHARRRLLQCLPGQPSDWI